MTPIAAVLQPHLGHDVVLNDVACSFTALLIVLPTALRMSAKRKEAPARLADTRIAAKRASSATPHAAAIDVDVSSSSSSLTTASSSLSAAPSSDWAHPRTELLSLILPYSLVPAVLHVALVNRRLHRLLLKAPSSASSHSSLWRCYPPVTLHINDNLSAFVVAN